jgi:hypothetical protein
MNAIDKREEEAQRTDSASTDQQQLDKQMKLRGQRAWVSGFYNRMASGDASTLSPLKHLAGGLHGDLTARLERLCVQAPPPGKYARGKWALAHYVQASSAEDVASVIIGQTMNLTMRQLHGMPFSQYAKIIGERIQDYVRQSAYIKAFKVDAYDYIDRAKRERYGNRKVKRRHVRRIIDRIEGFDPLPETSVTQATIGCAAWHLMSLTANIWEIQKRLTPRGHYQPWVVLRDAAYMHIRDLAEQFGQRRILPLPMVDVPRDWKVNMPWAGGYPELGKRGLVRGWTRKDCDLLGMSQRPGLHGDVKLNKMVDAVNLVQRTKFRMNPVVLEAHRWIIENDIACELYPRFVEKPTFEPAVWDNDETRLAARATLKQARVQRTKNLPKRSTAAINDVHMQMFAGREFYLPAAMGVFGRITYRPMINPQSSKGVRGCMEFAHAERLAGDESVEELFISVANDWGQDKTTLKERVAWVEENDAMLRGVAADYKRNQEWLDQEAPTMALRAALEYDAFKQEGHALESHYVCYRDQTCSGPSHFTSMLRDSAAYADCGLVPAQHRPDIYSSIAERAIEIARSIDTPVCQAIVRNGIARSIAKGVVMPGGYGGTKLGTYRKLRDEIVGASVAGEIERPFEDTYAYSKALNEVVWLAYEERLGRTRDAMKWLRSVAGEFAKQNTAVSWVSPSGQPVKLAKWQRRERKIETLIGEQLYRPTYWKDTDQLDVHKMRNTMPVAFVHSYEAGFLHNVLARLGADTMPVTSVVPIHDCIGVHANAVTQTIRTLKDEWHTQYHDQEIFERHYGEWQAICPEIPEPPKAGSTPFNLAGSDYFFH